MAWLTINTYLQLLCLQLLLLLLSHNSYAKLCPDEQSYALLQFKQLFSYDQNTHSSHCDRLRLLPSYPKMVSWGLDSDCCSWDGVTCNTFTGHVIGLDLDCSWLHGSIPSNTSLFLLPHLQSLNLAFNDFNLSPIYGEFAQLHSMTLLNLSSSNFSGQLPSEISHLSKLVSLDLSNNPEVKLETRILEGLVRDLTELEQLVLDSVDMSAITLGSMANLSNSLISLSLSSCGLQGNFPESIFFLPNLMTLKLAYNQNLTGFFPKENWSNPLRFLDVSFTNFSGTLPDEMSNLKMLRHLILNDCNFIGSIPTSLGNLTQLTRIDLLSNNFSGHIPSSLSNLDQLQYLDFSSDKFIGEIPDIFVNLQQLSYLDFSSNQLVGAIPSHNSKLIIVRQSKDSKSPEYYKTV
ncbi:hypothetical protein EZV62_008305 [Acer yangbiense]|uniref:Leucine-rich repeat-containing N-terminal plant-type domain-containing protein n=1 Tax=Acer yangbiense TaxID=1000413 RepID=A0A5C7ICH0_9ROSI|nr:hypothetical protein EZV62_008305 [Acer yangbiense]